jgi:MFS family permease
MVGMPLGAVGVASLALAQSPAWSWWLLMFFAALLGSGTLPTVWTRMVNVLFVRRRGLALGLVLSGSGLFALFGAPLAQYLIELFGWRGAWLGHRAAAAARGLGRSSRSPSAATTGRVPWARRARTRGAVPGVAGLTHREALRTTASGSWRWASAPSPSGSAA